MPTGAYDASNVFARILRGELPAERLFEDADTLAFMDIMPRVKGHALVVPKAPVRNILDAAPEHLAAVMRTVQRIARAQLAAFSADGITVQQFNETAGGQVVFHMHVHVLPRWEGIRLEPHTGRMENKEVLAENAKAIRAALAAPG